MVTEADRLGFTVLGKPTSTEAAPAPGGERRSSLSCVLFLRTYLQRLPGRLSSCCCGSFDRQDSRAAHSFPRAGC